MDFLSFVFITDCERIWIRKANLSCWWTDNLIEVFSLPISRSAFFLLESANLLIASVWLRYVFTILAFFWLRICLMKVFLVFVVLTKYMNNVSFFLANIVHSKFCQVKTFLVEFCIKNHKTFHTRDVKGFSGSDRVHSTDFEWNL